MPELLTTPKKSRRRAAQPPIVVTMPPALAAKAAQLEQLIAVRKAERLNTEAWEKALARIHETVKHQAVAWAEERARRPRAAAAENWLDRKHNLEPGEFRARFLAFARRNEQAVCQRCQGEWGKRETPARIHNAEGDELLIHAGCIVLDDVIL